MGTISAQLRARLLTTGVLGSAPAGEVAQDKIGKMVRGDWTAQAAIDQIYCVCGVSLLVTHVVN